MKRFHVHLSVADLDHSIRFYSALFGAEPAVLKTDYAKWMLDDPRVNFAVSQRGAQPGLDHLGFQVDSDAELAELNQRLAGSGSAVRGGNRRSLLLCTIQQVLVGRPAGNRLGRFPFPE